MRGVARDIGMEEVKPQEPKLDRITDQEMIRLLEAKIKQLEQEVAAAASAETVERACHAARAAFCRHVEAQLQVERDTLQAEWKADSARREARWQADCDRWDARLKQQQDQLKQRQQFEESLAVCLVNAIGLLKDAEAGACGCFKRRRLEDNVLESSLLSAIRANDSDDSMPPSLPRT